MALTDDPDFTAWLESVERDMLSKTKGSAVAALFIFGGHIDAKLCVEIGAAVLYDKPVVLIALPDAVVPANLERLAAAIVRGHPDDPGTRARFADAITRALER